MAGGYHGLKEFTAIYYGKKVVNAVYKGLKVAWEAALRIWKPTQIWKENETWKY